MQKKREEEAGGGQAQQQQPPPLQGSQYLSSSPDEGVPPPTHSLHTSMEFTPQSLALVPRAAPRTTLANQPPQPQYRQPYTSRAINPELAAYLGALSGPNDRQPLQYSGDIKASLDQLRLDAVSQYQELSHALGENADRLHLLLGSLGGRLGLPPAPPAPSLPTYSSAPLSLPPLPINHYAPSTAPSRPLALMAGLGSGGYGRSLNSAWSGGYEPPGSASFFGEGLGGGGLRISAFELDTGRQQALMAATPFSEAGMIQDADLMSGMIVGRETTRMIYSQAGRDFEGRQAKSAMAGQRIDSLRDLRYHKPSNIEHDDLLALVANVGMQAAAASSSLDQDAPRLLRSQQRSELDQTERFLRDFASRETRSRGAYSLPPQPNQGRREGAKDQEERHPFSLPQI